MMRLFIAIPLTEDVKGGLLEIQDAFRRGGMRGNFARPKNMHITLAFIGEFGDPDAVLEVMENVRFEPVDLRLCRVGAFGDLWWAGITAGEALEAMVRRLRRALSDAGIPFDRKRFMPHITLLRKAVSRKDAGPGAIDIPNKGMTADRIVLMQSTRGKNGMIYTELGSVSAQVKRH